MKNKTKDQFKNSNKHMNKKMKIKQKVMIKIFLKNKNFCNTLILSNNNKNPIKQLNKEIKIINILILSFLLICSFDYLF